MVVIHAAAIPLPVLLGYSSVLVLAYSMGLSYLATGAWLVAKGFGERPGRQE